MSLVKISSNYWVDLFKDDPVRPNLNPKFRLTENRVNFLLTQDFTKPCDIVCVAFTKDIFYTIWSYSKGSGKDILFNTVFWLKKNKPEIKRYITMSPKTEMARNFHLKNGAYELKSNRETINFEYII